MHSPLAARVACWGGKRTVRRMLQLFLPHAHVFWDLDNVCHLSHSSPDIALLCQPDVASSARPQPLAPQLGAVPRTHRSRIRLAASRLPDDSRPAAHARGLGFTTLYRVGKDAADVALLAAALQERGPVVFISHDHLFRAAVRELVAVGQPAAICDGEHVYAVTPNTLQIVGAQQLERLHLPPPSCRNGTANTAVAPTVAHKPPAAATRSNQGAPQPGPPAQHKQSKKQPKKQPKSGRGTTTTRAGGSTRPAAVTIDTVDDAYQYLEQILVLHGADRKPVMLTQIGHDVDSNFRARAKELGLGTRLSDIARAVPRIQVTGSGAHFRVQLET